MRKTQFVSGEYYHIYNRGVDKRNIFQDEHDLQRFFQSMQEFNTVEPIGSIYERNRHPDTSKKESLVEFIAYCLNPNHYHFQLKQVADKGIQKFMHRLGGGYTNYFNELYERNGALFQGSYKAKHISSDNYLLHLSVYINGNNRFGSLAPKLSKSSFEEYFGNESLRICNTSVVLSQFKDAESYKDFFDSSLKNIQVRKQMSEEFNLGAKLPNSELERK